MEPIAPGPPPFWFQNEKLFTEYSPPKLNVICPVKTPELETHELLGIVPACVAIKLGEDRPLALTVLSRLVPKPDPIFVVAVTPTMRSAETLV